jgi:PadR family transcriptional regulator, regulatory protein PadR
MLKTGAGRRDRVDWGPSEGNRRIRFCGLTQDGQKLREEEQGGQEQTAAIIAGFFEVKAEDLA